MNTEQMKVLTERLVALVAELDQTTGYCFITASTLGTSVHILPELFDRLYADNPGVVAKELPAIESIELSVTVGSVKINCHKKATFKLITEAA